MSDSLPESYAQRVRQLAEEKCHGINKDESDERIGRSMATLAACLDVIDDEEDEK